MVMVDVGHSSLQSVGLVWRSKKQRNVALFSARMHRLWWRRILYPCPEKWGYGTPVQKVG